MIRSLCPLGPWLVAPLSYQLNFGKKTVVAMFPEFSGNGQDQSSVSQNRSYSSSYDCGLVMSGPLAAGLAVK